MTKFRALCVLLFGVLVYTFGCGMTTPRTLQSVTVTPATADAMNFPSGQVQFVATGIFNKAPVQVTPFTVVWSVANASNIATIDQKGLAQCAPGKSGMVTIQIALQGDGPLMNEATLTCP